MKKIIAIFIMCTAFLLQSSYADDAWDLFEIEKLRDRINKEHTEIQKELDRLESYRTISSRIEKKNKEAFDFIWGYVLLREGYSIDKGILNNYANGYLDIQNLDFIAFITINDVTFLSENLAVIKITKNWDNVPDKTEELTATIQFKKTGPHKLFAFQVEKYSIKNALE